MFQYFNILLHIDIKNIYKQYFFNELTRIYFKIILITNLISKGIRLFNSNDQILKHSFMSCFLIYSKKDIRSKKNICIFAA